MKFNLRSSRRAKVGAQGLGLCGYQSYSAVSGEDFGALDMPCPTLAPGLLSGPTVQEIVKSRTQLLFLSA